MNIAILTFDGYNELDSFVALGILNRIRDREWNVKITSPSPTVTSMNGLTVQSQQTLSFANSADVVIFGSGILTRKIAIDESIMGQFKLDPMRQVICGQCSGTLLMAKLGLLKSLPACTDLTTKPWVIEAGVDVVNAPFIANNNIATAGGCLASQYLASWIIARLVSREAAKEAIHYVAPVGEKESTVAHNMSVISDFL
ncbi:MAG: AraC family transcriptional regulator [Gammaproteobacteria bacterium]|nr:AraC family transcriptional regulator [Gammaproteobacteria bacterium]